MSFIDHRSRGFGKRSKKLNFVHVTSTEWWSRELPSFASVHETSQSSEARCLPSWTNNTDRTCCVLPTCRLNSPEMCGKQFTRTSSNNSNKIHMYAQHDLHSHKARLHGAQPQDTPFPKFVLFLAPPILRFLLFGCGTTTILLHSTIEKTAYIRPESLT